MKIDEINLKIIPDSRGNETLEVEFVAGNLVATASVPSGKSKGSNEAYVLEPQKALEKFTKIKRDLLENEFSDIEGFDNWLIKVDGTRNKSKLGANLILVLSIGFTKLLALSENIPVYELIARIAGVKIRNLPLVFFNLIEGGVHTPPGDSPFQEYLFIPQHHSPTKNLADTMDFIKFLQLEISGRFEQIKTGDEGGFIVHSEDPLEGLWILQQVKELTNQYQARVGLDMAASSFYQEGVYQIGQAQYHSSQLLDLYRSLQKQFHLFSLEDPFWEQDWPGFVDITKSLGKESWIVGDDLTTTNSEMIKVAAEKKAVNAMIIKPNQIGSVSETIKAANLAKSLGWKIIVSHRSGETMDIFIADLAVGLQANGLKSGCPLQKERLVKYQRLIEIEQKLQ